MAKIKVLVVDDDPDTRLIVRARLMKHGYDVVLASDCIQAISVARQQSPDVILLDIGLPGGNGFIVLERLKSITSLASTPVIVISSLDPAQAEMRALDGGAVAYIQKPVDGEKILSAVNAALPSPA
jgi:DNA-binding response OmpR family regulator